MPAQRIDPLEIWLHADGFYQTLYILCNVHPNNQQVGAWLAQPTMVIGAFTIELFFKCLICLETEDVPRIHDLKELFDMLNPKTQARIEAGWASIANHRSEEWDTVEKVLSRTIARDLRGALTAGSKAFEKIRYSYEGVEDDVQYYLQDLPRLLGRVILERKPDWENLQRPLRPLQPLQDAQRHP
jgi:hypothetical protein